jgi:WSC domain
VGPIPAPYTPPTVGNGPAKYTSIGCWKDSVSSRSLDGAYYRGNDVTPSQCASWCYSQQFRVAGVEFGIECFCGEELLNPDYAPPGDCNEACAGDSTKTCGQENRLNVYVGVDTPDVLRPEVLAGTDILDQYISVGCYSDSYDSRTLTGYNYTTPDMTPDACA